MASQQKNANHSPRFTERISTLNRAEHVINAPIYSRATEMSAQVLCLYRNLQRYSNIVLSRSLFAFGFNTVKKINLIAT